MTRFGRVRTQIGSCAAIFVLAAACPRLLPAAQHWVRLSTEHFEMYTTNSVGSATRSLETFERVRSFFLEASPSKQAPDTPVRIVAFRSESEFKNYRPNDGAFAYYQPSRKRDYIVMQDLGVQSSQAAVHEYTHLIINHAKLNLPIWLNEGTAELYSSMEPHGAQTMVGRPIEGRLYVLANERWMNLKLLTSVAQDSPYYNERNKMSIFYAQSWALTHMLVLGKEYQPQFSRFLAAMASGADAEKTFASIYRKTLAQVQEDLRNDLTRNTVQVALFDVKLDKRALQPEVADLTPLSTDLALADLTAGLPRKAAEARQKLQQIAEKYPQNAEVEESLGYFAWQTGDQSTAVSHFAQAMQKGSSDPEMLYHYGALLGHEPGQLEASIAALHKALELKPRYHEAQYVLGLRELEAHRYGSSLSLLVGLKNVTSDEAYNVYTALAICHSALKSPPDQVRMLATQARRYAKTSEQQEHADELLRHLDRAEIARNSPPSSVPAANTQTGEQRPIIRHQRDVLVRDQGLEHVTGQVSALECRGAQLFLHLQTEGQDKVFAMGDPKQIIVHGTEQGHIDFSCGPIKPRSVTVFFAPSQTPSLAGEVRELEF